MSDKRSKILRCAVWFLLVAEVPCGSSAVKDVSPRLFYASPMSQVVELPEVTAHALSGTVVNGDGSPIPHARVEMIAMKGRPLGKALRTITTDENGQFAFPSSTNQRYRLRISKEGYRTIVVVFHVSSKAINRRFVLQMPVGV